MSRRRFGVAAIATSLLIAATTATASAADGADEPTADSDRIVEVAPREHRVAVFADSVGLGARTAIPAAFPADWEVNVDGQPARFVEQLENDYVKYRLAVSPQWFGDHVVIAGGYNYPYWDPARFERSVDSIINTLTAAGVKHVYWVTLREIDPQYISASAWRQVQPYYWYFPTVNDHLERALDRHPNLTLVDWAANANRPGITYDAIHLNTTGAALYSSLIVDAVNSTATTVPDGSTTKVHVPDADGAVAATVNLTTTNPRRAGHLSVHRCDQSPPGTSVHNFSRGQVVAHVALAPLDANGDFCVTTLTQTNLVVDVTGTLAPEAGFRAVGPTRWHDSRIHDGGQPIPAGGVLRLDVDDVRAAAGLTDDPTAVVLNVTAVGAGAPGHITVSQCGASATHSNVNFAGAAGTPNLVVAEPDADGAVCLSTTTRTHVVVDLFGVFDETAGVDVAVPTRLFDSREVGGGAKVPAGGVVELDVGDELSPGAGAIVNLTGVLPDVHGHFTPYPCAEGRPETSSLNLAPGDVVANVAFVAPDGDGKICVATHGASHMVVDLLGEVGDVFVGRRPLRVLDTRLG